MAEIAKLHFRKRTWTGKTSSFMEDKIAEDAQASPLANSLWNNTVEQCNVKETKGCESLCFKNIVKQYAIMGGF